MRQTIAVLFGISLYRYVQSISVSIWAVPMQPNWPVMITAIVADQQLSSNAVFQWEFPDDSTQSCRANSRANVLPCIGKVVDHSFASTGSRAIKLTITDSTLSSPLVVTGTVNIYDPNSFTPSPRPEIRQLSMSQWQKYVDALYKLKDLGVYDHFAALHSASLSHGSSANTQRTTAHASPTFLLWHRSQMRVVERAIQYAAGDDSMGLPYWDWQKGIDGMDPYMGPGNSQDDLVSSGPFCNNPQITDNSACPHRWVLPQDYPDNVKGLRRRYGTDPTFHFQTQREYDALMSYSVYDIPPFSDVPAESFRSALEGWLAPQNRTAGLNHNGVHRWVGGTMGNVAESFHDPMFLIHHCNVDRLFTIWQALRGCNGQGSAICYRPGITDPGINAGLPGAQLVTADGQTYYAIVGAMFSDQMWPWNLRPADLLAPNQGYFYLDTNQVPPAPAPKPTPTPNPTPGPGSDSQPDSTPPSGDSGSLTPSTPNTRSSPPAGNLRRSSNSSTTLSSLNSFLLLACFQFLFQIFA